MGSLDFIFLQVELKDALLAVKRSIRQIQTKVSLTLDNSEMTIFVILFNFGFERIAKIILLLKQHMESSKFPKRRWFLKNYGTHDVKLLLDNIKNELITKIFLSSNIIAQEDYNYIFKDKRDISNKFFDYCSYMSNAREGRYENFKNILEGTFKMQKEDKLDKLFVAIMDSHDTNWKDMQQKEVNNIYRYNQERLNSQHNTITQHPRPYNDQMHKWLRSDLTIIIERLIRMLSFLFQDAYLGEKSKTLIAGTGLYAFRCMKDSELGTTKY